MGVRPTRSWMLRCSWALPCLIASVLLLVLCPRLAWAAAGDVIGYAYLDPDDSGENTVLVVQDTERSDAEINRARCMDLGPWRDEWGLPWDERRDSIRSARFDAKDGRVRPSNLGDGLFSNCALLESVDLSGLDTSGVTDMRSMFNGCSSLRSVNLSDLDASNVTSMWRMFEGCSSLESVDITGLDTSSVTSMSGMFEGCSSLRSVDITGLDTSRVTNMSFMFSDCSSLESVDLSGLDTSSVEVMWSMFYGCSSLESVDLSGLDTSNVTGMSNMFQSCSSLRSADLSGLDTSRVTSVSGMFQGCKSLESVDLSGFDTSNVTYMSSVFSGCSSLGSVDLSGFDTSTATSMSGMFHNCSSLESLDLSGFDTSGVADLSDMFIGCRALCELTIGNGFALSESSGFPFDRGPWMHGPGSDGGMATVEQLNAYAAGLEEASTIFREAFEVPTSGTCGTCNWSVDGDGVLEISPADGAWGQLGPLSYANTPWWELRSSIKAVRVAGLVSASHSLCSMFHGCSSLRSVDLSGLDTSNVRNMSSMFDGCSSLASLDLSGFDASNVTSMSYMFQGCRSLRSVDLSGINTSNVTDMSYIFSGCSSLESVGLSGLDTSGVTNMRSMFNACSSLRSIDLSGFDTSAVTSMAYMFQGCRSLRSVDLSGFDTSNVTHMTGMFDFCSSLESIDLSNLNTSNVTSMYGMFSSCSSLESVDFSGLDTSGVTDMSSMFNGCSSLQSVDLSGLDTSRVTSMSSMFDGCSSLSSLDLSAFDTSAVTTAYSVFEGCNSLHSVTFGESFSLATELPIGVWERESDRARFKSGEIPSVAGVYRRLTSGYVSGVAYASLGDDGVLTISSEESMGEAGAYALSEFGYECAEEVPWFSQRDGVRAVNVVSAHVRSLAHWFEGCANLEEADLSGVQGLEYSWDPWSRNSSMAHLFDGCASLRSVDFGDIDAFNVIDFSEMFRGCSSLESLDLSSLRTGRAQSMRRMFHGCRSLGEVKLGYGFTFRGAGVGRLPGSEFPDGAWAAESDPKTAYDSASIPSFAADTYVRVPDADLEDPEKGITLVSSRGEDDQGKPQLQVASTIAEGEDGAEERLEYTVADDYAGEQLYVGESPRAQALKFSSGKVKWNTVVSKIYASNRNYWTTSAVIGPRVKSIAPYAFDSAPNIQTLHVRSAKLKKYSKVASSLAYSNVVQVWVSGMSASNVRKVVDAFNNWAWMG